ncbi:hypothetical protein GCWU000341_00923 [Oribacterium sp. oral taxon 078 str. F0262]|nr:hypothetical protein GCWU000341_00923 [Oribacterium sp. oral taxon 078 str. F0262]
MNEGFPCRNSRPEEQKYSRGSRYFDEKMGMLNGIYGNFL